MSENGACDCQSITAFSGDFKSQATSLTFTMCDGDVATKVPADTVGDYLINTIYGDASGDPPAEGCYAVCYDANGTRSIVGVATQSELDAVNNSTNNSINSTSSSLQAQIDDLSQALSVRGDLIPINETIFSGSAGSGATISVDITSILNSNGITAQPKSVVINAIGRQNNGGNNYLNLNGDYIVLMVRSDGEEDDVGGNNQGVYINDNNLLSFSVSGANGFDYLDIFLESVIL